MRSIRVREAVQERLNEEMQEQAAESKTLKLTEFVTVSELATMIWKCSRLLITV